MANRMVAHSRQRGTRSTPSTPQPGPPANCCNWKKKGDQFRPQLKTVPRATPRRPGAASYLGVDNVAACTSSREWKPSYRNTTTPMLMQGYWPGFRCLGDQLKARVLECGTLGPPGASPGDVIRRRAAGLAERNRGEQPRRCRPLPSCAGASRGSRAVGTDRPDGAARPPHGRAAEATPSDRPPRFAVVPRPKSCLGVPDRIRPD